MEEPIQDLLVAKIAELEVTKDTDNNNSNYLVKNVKNQPKEIKQFIILVVNSSDSNEEKIKQLNAKFQQLVQDNLNMASEREKINAQLQKATNMKSKMEQLFRELQKQNKTIVDESKKTAEQEQEKRQELSKKFHDTIQQISTKMEEQGEDRIKLYKENDMFREKLKSFAEQYQLREQHFDTQLKAKDLEMQLLEAKLKQQSEIATQETLRAQAYNEQITTLTAREKELSTQLAYYAEKFEQFQDTLTKSNEIFTTFKQEMEKMSKTIKKSEKENTELKKKCEQTDVALIELAEERNNYKKQLETLIVQKKKLEDLCRALQIERKQQPQVTAQDVHTNSNNIEPQTTK